MRKYINEGVRLYQGDMKLFLLNLLILVHFNYSDYKVDIKYLAKFQECVRLTITCKNFMSMCV